MNPIDFNKAIQLVTNPLPGSTPQTFTYSLTEKKNTKD